MLQGLNRVGGDASHPLEQQALVLSWEHGSMDGGTRSGIRSAKEYIEVQRMLDDAGQY